ncbi:MAG: response regulator transcription factor [Treponema sp.]|jgi:DNA-binding NarL/FixJ family response regulator|nr:response regulator transcription factor [Treponema sp.]
MKTLVLIDDHAMLRRGLSSWLAEDGQWQTLGEAASLEEAAALFERLAGGLPDLALLDIDLNTPGRPGSWGLDLIPFLKERYGEKTPPVLVYSVYDDYVHLKAAFRSGAKGYVCKSQDTGELRAAMDQLSEGGLWFSPGHAFRVAAVSDIVLGLTKRERQIFELVQCRSSNREIAAELGVSLRTVENNLSILYDKTAAKNRKELEQL